MNGYRTLHLNAAFLHFALLITVIIFTSISSVDTNVSLLRYSPRVVSKSANTDIDLNKSSVGVVSSGRVNLSIMLGVVCVVTMVAHLLYALNTNRYIKEINQSKNRFRWLEYAISASLMMVIIALLCGVRDRSTLILLFGGVVMLMYIGYISEVLTPKASLCSMLIGWGLLCVLWYVVISQFYDNIGESSNAPTSLSFLIFVLVGFYISFGVVQTLFVVRKYRGTKVNFATVDKSYIVLSFISKAVLVLWCLFGVFVGGVDWLHIKAQDNYAEPRNQ